MKKAIYAFSGDPITKGHIDIISRSSKFFDQLIVAIGNNSEKNYTFDINKRIEMTKTALSKIKNIKVISFKGLLVDYAYENNIPLIIKGVRNTDDFIYENKLHSSGETQKLGIETFLLFANPSLSHISSSGVKQMQIEQALIYDLVSVNVKEELEKKLSSQHILGITGEIGSGKTFVCNEIIKLAKKNNINIHHIELDEIGHSIYKELKEPVYDDIRKKIVKEFGNKVSNKDGTINRKRLGEIVFNNKSKLKKLNEIMFKPMLVRFRREIYGKKGLILFNAALLAESDLINLCNNNILLIKCDKKIQEKRLKDRKLNKDQIKRRLESQYSYSEKRKIILSKINENNYGNLWEFNNSGNENIKTLFEKIIKKLFN